MKKPVSSLMSIDEMEEKVLTCEAVLKDHQDQLNEINRKLREAGIYKEE